MVSAAAALTGLIFVGVSISLPTILTIPAMPGRASESLILLITVLITSSVCLVPGLPAFFTGVILLSIGAILWVASLRIDIGIYRNTDAQYKRHAIQNIVFTQIAVLPYIIAGAIMINCGFTGIYWLVPGIFFSFIKAVVDAWVLLVEINR
jgi:modulator of FtsH protease